MKAGSKLESYVKYVYEIILNLKGENILVSQNAIIFGVSGAKHEIDVFYQFEKANVLHKVAIECKDTETPVVKGKVQEFFGKIEDIHNIIGIMVSKTGYQKGAKTYGEAKGILLLETKDLPNLFDLLRNQIGKFFLPMEDDIGEPFWGIMQIDKDHKINGNYCVMECIENPRGAIPLFLSRHDAKTHWQHLSDKDGWTIRGLRQYHLKAICEWSKIQKNYFYIILNIDTNGKYAARKIKYNTLKDEYYYGN